VGEEEPAAMEKSEWVWTEFSGTLGMAERVRVYAREEVRVEDGVRLAVTCIGPAERSEVGEKPKLVFVHPMGLLGGCAALERGKAVKLAALGYVCVLFDLRGAGDSTGSATVYCNAEVGDVRAVLRWLGGAGLPGAGVVLIGNSAGGPVAGSVLGTPEAHDVKGYYALGYTWGWWASLIFGQHFDACMRWPGRKHFVMGEVDGFTSVSQLQDRCSRMQKATYRIIDGLGHFELEGPEYDSVHAREIDSFARSL
jgi:uncharacterized protein